MVWIKTHRKTGKKAAGYTSPAPPQRSPAISKSPLSGCRRSENKRAAKAKHLPQQRPAAKGRQLKRPAVRLGRCQKNCITRLRNKSTASCQELIADSPFKSLPPFLLNFRARKILDFQLFAAQLFHPASEYIPHREHLKRRFWSHAGIP